MVEILPLASCGFSWFSNTHLTFFTELEGMMLLSIVNPLPPISPFFKAWKAAIFQRISKVGKGLKSFWFCKEAWTRKWA